MGVSVDLPKLNASSSANHRVAEQLRMEGTSGDHLLAAGSARGGCSRPVSSSVLNISVDGEAPRLLWETRSSAHSRNKEGVFMLRRIFSYFSLCPNDLIISKVAVGIEWVNGLPGLAM